jgi:hypothetical protein
MFCFSVVRGDAESIVCGLELRGSNRDYGPRVSLLGSFVVAPALPRRELLHLHRVHTGVVERDVALTVG